MRKKVLVSTAFLVLASSAAVLHAGAQEQKLLRLDKDTSFVLFELMAVITQTDSLVSVNTIIPTGEKRDESGGADLQEGDVIVMANGRRITGVKDMHEIYDKLQTGEPFKLGVRRGKEMLIISVPKSDSDKMEGGGRMIIRKAATDDKK